MKLHIPLLVLAYLGLVTTPPLSAQQPELRTTLEGHTLLVSSVAFSPDSKTLASGSHDQTVRLWDVNTSKEKAILKHPGKEPWMINSVTFSPDGKTLAAGSVGAVTLWDVSTTKEKTTLKGHHPYESITSVAFSPDGKTLATACRDKTVRMWDVDTGKEKAALKGAVWVYAVAFSPDAKTLAAAAGDDEGAKGIKRWGEVKLWHLSPTKTDK